MGTKTNTKDTAERICETCGFGDPDRDDMIWCEEKEQLMDPDESCCHWVVK